MCALEAFQNLSQQVALGVYVAAKLDQEMFENSNRFEERFMIQFVDDLQILLESEEKVPPRQIPQNYSTKPLTMDIAFMKNETEPKRKAGIWGELKGLFNLKKTSKPAELKKKKFDVLPYLKGLVFSADSQRDSSDSDSNPSQQPGTIELSSQSGRRSDSKPLRGDPQKQSRSTLPKASIMNNLVGSSQDSRRNLTVDGQSQTGRGTFREDSHDFFRRKPDEEFKDLSAQEFQILSVRSNLRNQKSHNLSDDDFDTNFDRRADLNQFKSDEDSPAKPRNKRVKTENREQPKLSSSRFIRGSVSRRHLKRQN